MGKKGGGSQTSTSSTEPPAYIKQAFQDIMGKGNQVYNLPLTQYGGPQLAGFTPMQESGFSDVAGSGNAWGNYYDKAANYFDQGAGDIWGEMPEYSTDNLQTFMNPYTDNVVNSTLAAIRRSDAEQQQDLTGNAIMAGAWGGSGAMDAKGNLARDQATVRNDTISGLYNQAYESGANKFMADRAARQNALQTQRGNQMQAGQSYAGLGASNLSNILNAANAKLQAGGQQQGMVQQQLDIPYQQFLQQQGYPYQQLQYLSNMVSGISGGAGGTTTSTQPGQKSGSSFGDIVGLGISAAGLFSDRRVKKDIERVGQTDDGLPIYTYKYKGGNGPTQMGLMAQDVEKVKPDAVTERGGLKMVNYDRATHARGGAIDPSQFQFTPATLNAPAAIAPQQQEQESGGMDIMSMLEGLSPEMRDSIKGKLGGLFGDGATHRMGKSGIPMPGRKPSSFKMPTFAQGGSIRDQQTNALPYGLDEGYPEPYSRSEMYPEPVEYYVSPEEDENGNLNGYRLPEDIDGELEGVTTKKRPKMTGPKKSDFTLPPDLDGAAEGIMAGQAIPRPARKPFETGGIVKRKKNGTLDLGSGRRIARAEGGQIQEEPIVTTTQSPVAPTATAVAGFKPIVAGTPVYSFDPNVAKSYGVKVSTAHDDILKNLGIGAAAPATSKPGNQVGFSAFRDYMMDTDDFINQFGNEQISNFHVAKMNANQGGRYNEENLDNYLRSMYEIYGQNPGQYTLPYAKGGRVCYANGGYLPSRSKGIPYPQGTTGMVPGVSPIDPSNYAGTDIMDAQTRARLSAPRRAPPPAPTQMRGGGEKVSGAEIARLVQQMGGMDNANDLGALPEMNVGVVPQAVPVQGQEPQKTGLRPATAQPEDMSQAPQSWADRLMDDPTRVALLSAGAAMLGNPNTTIGDDIAAGIRGGVAGYTAVKKSKADAKKAAEAMLANAEQQKFENDLAERRVVADEISASRPYGSSRGPGTPLDVSPNEMASIEEQALRMVPGAVDENGDLDPALVNLTTKDRLRARKAASRIYQDTRNADEAISTYLEELDLSPETTTFEPKKAAGIFTGEKPAKINRDKSASILKEARDAIAKGAPRDKVIERLKQNGVDPKGL